MLVRGSLYFVGVLKKTRFLPQAGCTDALRISMEAFLLSWLHQFWASRLQKPLSKPSCWSKRNWSGPKMNGGSSVPLNVPSDPRTRPLASCLERASALRSLPLENINFWSLLRITSDLARRGRLPALASFFPRELAFLCFSPCKFLCTYLYGQWCAHFCIVM